MTAAAAAGLQVDDAEVIHDSDRIAVRLLPADVLARVVHERRPTGPGAEVPGFEVEVARAPGGGRVPDRHARSSGGASCPCARRLRVTFWTYYEPLPGEIAPPEYAEALRRLHAGMRQAELVAPPFTDRVAAAQTLLGDRARTPALGDADRELLGTFCRR
jgi:hypothetical protein